MASDSLRFTVGLVLTVGLAGRLLEGPAHAAPPSEADFRVTYYLTDEQGERTRQLSTYDMNQLVNQARCQCEQQIIARIGRTSTSMVDAVQVLTMVGQQCGVAQAAPGISQYALCAQLVGGLPTVFQNAPEYRFDPIWLAYGSDSDQSIESATPAGSCDSIYGQGGIWMCAGATDCMMGNFFMQGTSNTNIAMGGTAQGVLFDFVPPLTAPSNFAAQPGDSAVEIVWDATSIGDISGYRVLCADENGNPVEGAFDFTRPTASTLVNGQIYYTRDNLCPGGPFGAGYEPDGPGWPDDSTGTDTGTDTSGTDTSGTDTSSDSSSSDSGSSTSASTTTDSGTDTTTDTGGGTDPRCDNGACDGILSLDWDYVCSGHVASASQSARIEGLENGKTYQFLVVPYDVSGNPLETKEVIFAAPVKTNGLWEQCEAQGNICGEPGFCAVVEPSRGFGWLFGGLALLGLGSWGVWARRRGNA